MGVSSPDFRAPPPSPVASSRRSSFTANEDVLSEFLDKCGRVPNLVLPDKVFPKHRFLLNPPTFDFLRLGSSSPLLMDAIDTIGCFQLINHGVPETKVRAAADKIIFQDETEEFVFYKDVDDACNSDLRELMGEAERIGKAIREKLGGRSQEEEEEEEEEEEGVGVCYVKKHNSQIESQGWEEEEAIRMLIRGYDERHSLCLSFCHAEFHVYSKRGWFSFSPRPDAVVVTVGDQGWSGRFKAVVGRPLLHRSAHASLPRNFVSISFLYTAAAAAAAATTRSDAARITHHHQKNTISIYQQLFFALILTLIIPFFFT
ncbi:hypothetical protein BRARA_G02001 [Brassica rapa]|uniref:Non-haem dioxygenase N-terminal domain-containing protein n=2 Tax=Brassica TaxID=3705 RepID=A0A397YMS2_BRACM|nr:uncharacterized protein LOC103830394 [Brassica rapa]RID54699.1 hypothetical protein BRARA_G02001 [Brassica rapa]CAF2176769.1 unnamed protein product [Brassica napus]CAG7903172.1 unnamed protein product [Brassica rapa]VDC99937.1 unnamed protein product [Brassica rapa]